MANKANKSRKEDDALRALQESLQGGSEVPQKKQKSNRYEPVSEEPFAVSAAGFNRGIEKVHAKVTNKLARELKTRGYEPNGMTLAGDLKPDLVLMKPHLAVFEVKTGGNLQTLELCAGQLVIYSSLIKGRGKAKMIAVLPAYAESTNVVILRNAGFSVVLSRKAGRGIKLTGLDKVLGKPRVA